jgi:hypothetical protein
MAKRPEETNPFLHALEIPAIYKLNPTEYIKEGGTILSTKIIDKSTRCSVYTDSLFSWFPKIPTAAKDMVLWIAAHLPFEQTYLEMEMEKYCKEMEIAQSTFYACRVAILNHLIIPRTSRKNTYWVNPEYLYKGSRIKNFGAQIKFQNEDPLEKLKAEKPTKFVDGEV